MMTALRDEPAPPPASAWARSSCGRARPPRPKAPILMKLRRDTPSQKRESGRPPKIVNNLNLPPPCIPPDGPPRRGRGTGPRDGTSLPFVTTPRTARCCQKPRADNRQDLANRLDPQE